MCVCVCVYVCACRECSQIYCKGNDRRANGPARNIKYIETTIRELEANYLIIVTDRPLFATRSHLNVFPSSSLATHRYEL